MCLCHLQFLSSASLSFQSIGVLFPLVLFSHSVVSDYLQPHWLQHARPPCPSPTPRVFPNSCPLSRWCHPTITSSAIPFSSCCQSFPASGSFQMSQLFTSGGQIIGVSASASVLPMNTQDWSPLEWTGWISLQSKGLPRVFSNTTPQFSSVQFSRSVVSDSLQPHGLQQARAPCPSPTPGTCSKSCPSSWWCHPTISSSVVPFSSCLQSFPASGSFQMSWFFPSGDQSTGASASAQSLQWIIRTDFL